MEVVLRLLDLEPLHPGLLWDTILVATAAVLGEGRRESPFLFDLSVEDVPRFGSGTIRFVFDGAGISPQRVEQVRRTFEPSRRVEMAAITVAAAALFHAGEHQIVGMAHRGSGADYLVGEEEHHLEVAGRSRRVDLAAAWEQKWKRLRGQAWGACYVAVSEFETLTGRLGFRDLPRGGSDGDGGVPGQ